MSFQEITPDHTAARMRAQRLIRLRSARHRLTMCSLGADTEKVDCTDGEASGECLATAGRTRDRLETATACNRVHGRLVFSTILGNVVCGARDETAHRAALAAFSVMSEALRREIESVLRTMEREIDALEEIRLSLQSQSSIVVRGEERTLSIYLGKEDLLLAVRGICHGTPFSYRAELAEGYLPFVEGVRVGAIGEAHYDESKKLVGISDVHTLVFRIPHGAARGEGVERLHAYFGSKTVRGCLILGAPRSGKTTLLRALAGLLSTGADARRVAVVDTRREFLSEDCASGWMDVLRGYRRCEGASIALRTLSPECIVMDEIGTQEDVDAIRCVLASGVSLLATAHARDIADAEARPCLRVLLEERAFDHVLVIQRGCDGNRLSLYRV